MENEIAAMLTWDKICFLNTSNIYELILMNIL